MNESDADARLLDDAERAERAGDQVAAAAALRAYLAGHADDGRARLRFARLLMASGERAAARRALEPLEALDADDPVGREAIRRLAELDEAEGAVLAAAQRWERILADDIDDAQARAHLALLRPRPAGRDSPGLGDSETLVSPEGVEMSRFRLLREIGRGATATVYLARDIALDLDVALKVLHPQQHPEAVHRFFAEARLAAAIRHPGVVAIYDLDERARVLAMEWIRGGTLRERLRAHGPLANDELAATARSLLAAIAFVHARGVVHGDLKPSNLLLRAPGDVVLADFGAAQLPAGRTTGRAGGAYEQPGTPLYLAPEQFRGEPASPATDLFAAGAILWEAAVGRPLRSHADLVRPGDAAHVPTLPAEGRARIAARGPEMTTLVLALLDPNPVLRRRSAAQ